MRKRSVLLTAPFALVFLLASCQSPVAMWQACSVAPDGNASGSDATYILRCEGGTWVPVMTIDEFVRLSRGQKVTIAPLPTRPTTTTIPGTAPTTSSTTSTTTTSSSTTTSTTVLVTSTLSFSNAQDETLSNFGYLTGSGLQPGAPVVSCSDLFQCNDSGVTVDSNGNAGHSGAMFAATGCPTNIYFTSIRANGQPITSNTASYPAGTPGCP